MHMQICNIYICIYIYYLYIQVFNARCARIKTCSSIFILRTEGGQQWNRRGSGEWWNGWGSCKSNLERSMNRNCFCESKLDFAIQESGWTANIFSLRTNPISRFWNVRELQISLFYEEIQFHVCGKSGNNCGEFILRTNAHSRTWKVILL